MLYGFKGPAPAILTDNDQFGGVEMRYSKIFYFSSFRFQSGLKGCQAG